MSNPSGKLFIGGLSFDTTDETFKEYFQQFGDVTDAFVLRDNVTKRSRGFGFVTFKSEAGADKCLAHPSPHVLDKRQVEAKKATPRDQTPMGDGPPHHHHRSSKKIFVGGLHYDTDKVGLRKYFEQYGKILSSEVMYNRETNKSRGFGFVIYADAESVDRALETRMHIIDNKQAEVKRATPRVSSPIKPNVGIVKGNVNGNNYNSSGTNSVPSNTQSNSKASIPVPAAPIQRNMSWANVVSKGPEKKTTAQTTDGGGNNSSNNSMNNNNSQNQKSTNNATSSLSALGTKT
eukprot:g1043.t1